ncbi:formyl transferase [Thermosipho africanus Ob7]|uniref:methionyl-tRNA formyltransferase n=1 Tax=Thermosipho africanus TaxID=2421 RepID=UPI000E0A1A3A|nr:methionyl-tRNA formyltransferase [Thermosipho africanus]RDI90108.1 formyl transferase [Thermosipho africanus Ob7]
MKKILFIGSKEIGEKTLKLIANKSPESLCGIVTINDENDMRSRKNNIIKIGENLKIPVFIGGNPEIEKIINLKKPDLALVVGWYKIIPERILKMVPMGFFGLHHSLLPKYRGGSPLVWAVINDEKVVGTTLFKLANGIDNGPIFDQKKLEINEKDYISDIIEKISVLDLEMIEKFIFSVKNDLDLNLKIQNEKDATYCLQRKPDDGKINWNWPIKKCYNFIRAQSKPYPGAFTYFENSKIIIWKASMTNTIFYGKPGTIVIFNGKLGVITGDQKLMLLENIEKLGNDKIKPFKTFY